MADRDGAHHAADLERAAVPGLHAAAHPQPVRRADPAGHRRRRLRPDHVRTGRRAAGRRPGRGLVPAVRRHQADHRVTAQAEQAAGQRLRRRPAGQADVPARRVLRVLLPAGGDRVRGLRGVPHESALTAGGSAVLPAEDAPGYRVLDQAGQGGFAVVYRAYQERLDRVVALKVLSVDRVDQRTMRRFQRELQLTGRLTGHPNVVTVFDTGVTSSGKPYIAMDFFEHGSLRDRVRKEGPLPVPEVLRAGVKLAGALAAVHEAGVLHGDIKPQNILISRYGEPAIADFGVARVVDSAEISATSQAFTPLHAAPEVLTGQPHSVSTDIYSLGSTLYHLLAGQPAFHNPTDPSIAPLMYRVLAIEPPAIRRSDVPPPVLETILRAMAKQPEQRYGSARELARRLQEVQAELGLSVTDLVGQDPGPGPTMSTVPRRRHDDPTAGGHPGRAPQAPAPQAPAPQAPGPHTANPHTVDPHTVDPHTGRPPSGQFPATGHHLPVAGHHLPAGNHPPSGDHYLPGAGHAAPAGQPSAHAPGLHAAGPPRPAVQEATGALAGGTRRRLLVGAAVAAVVVGGSGAAIYVSLHQPPKPPATRPEAEPPEPPATAETTAPIDRKSVAALAPRGLKVTADQGALVELHWTLPPDARRYPVVLQRSPLGKGDQPVTALGQGTTTTRVAGLDPETGYCFLVGVPLRISESSTVAWSKPLCIRGAVARSAQ
ncbi:protein kinase [Nonomuraea phyllanthi]|uniref:non-specific serine/threonine protein kinase n=1 Tax=Nonomuraea phyllanthi TaxID=2219224 RepID=A0A5C4V361_9ACTN|nr:protein kinase [Nonomuraea phyllanthi]